MNLTVDYDSEHRRFSIAVPNRQQLLAINEWPGWRRYPNGTYMAPAWASAVLGIKKSTFQITWTPNAAYARDELLEKLGNARAFLSNGKGYVRPIAVPTARRPLPHQHQAVCAIWRMDYRALLADDMGLGKTSTALWSVEDSHATRLLVICPVSVKFNWKNEIEATLGSAWSSVVINGTSKKRAQQFAEAEAVRKVGRKTAIIINYDLLRQLSEQQLELLKAWCEQSMLLVDESHYLKGKDTERTQLVASVAERAFGIIAMTGTPIRNLADDLFAQVELIRPGTWTSYRDFAKRHLVIQSVKFGKRETHKIVGVRNLDALNAVMNTLQIKRAKSEVLDLPPKTYTFPELQLEGDLLKVYKAMKDFARIELKRIMHTADVMVLPTEAAGQVISPPQTIFDPRARSAVEQAMRCEQIAQGFIGGIPQPIMDQLGPDILRLAEKIPQRPNELMFPTAPKVVWMLETIESILKQGGAPLVGCRFNAPMIWMHNHLTQLGVKAAILHGGLSAEAKAAVIASFQNKEVDVLLAQVKIAEGWNAQRSQDVIHWTRDWSPAINSQFEDRAHRMGQKGTVNVQVPVVRNTIEKMIHRRLAEKRADAEQALRNVTIEELIEAL